MRFEADVLHKELPEYRIGILLVIIRFKIDHSYVRQGLTAAALNKVLSSGTSAFRKPP